MDLDERFEAPTLWGATVFIADEILRVGQEFMGLELVIKPVQKEIAWLKSIQMLKAQADRSGVAIKDDENPGIGKNTDPEYWAGG